MFVPIEADADVVYKDRNVVNLAIKAKDVPTPLGKLVQMMQ